MQIFLQIFFIQKTAIPFFIKAASCAFVRGWGLGCSGGRPLCSGGGIGGAGGGEYSPVGGGAPTNVGLGGSDIFNIYKHKRFV